MSYYDKTFGNVLPTRQGAATGTANERQMLDRIGGSAGYRKQFQANPDGSTTMLTTKNGMPQFTELNPALPNTAPDTDDMFLGMDSGAMQGAMDADTTYTRTGENTIPEGERAEFVNWIDASLNGKQPYDNSTTDALGASDLIKKCPASIFTGRTRFYIQCLYGRLTSKKNALGKTITNAMPDVSVIDTGVTIPSLTINNVPVDTSSGVFFDHVNVDHYLLNITTGRYYKLKRTVNATKLIELIQDPTVAPERKLKAEAYILAHSVPDSTKFGTLELPYRPSGAFGYGWHFNWTGTECAMVQVDYDGTTNYSYIHTITFINHDGVISASYHKGPEITWNNKRDYQVITYPLWDFSGFKKIGQKYATSDTGGSNAPFYIYYYHDTNSFPGSSTQELCTFRAYNYVKPAHVVRREPYYLNPYVLYVLGTDTIDYVTAESHPTSEMSVSAGSSIYAESYDRTENAMWSTAPITPSTDAGLVSWYHSGYYTQVVQIPNGRPITPIPLRTIGTPYGDMNVQNGIPTGFNDYAHITYDFGVMGELENGAQEIDNAINNFPATWKTGYSSDAVHKDGRVVVVVPYFDAESILLYKWSREYKTRNKTTRDHAGPGPIRGYGYARVYSGPAFATANTVERVFDPIYTGGSVAVASVDVEEPAPVTQQKFSGNFGEESPENMPDASVFLNPFHDVVPSFIDARSSVGKSLYSVRLDLDVNNKPANFSGKYFSYVGWA